MSTNSMQNMFFYVKLKQQINGSIERPYINAPILIVNR